MLSQDWARGAKMDLTQLLQWVGLDWPSSWLWTIGLAFVWLMLMLAYSPIADVIASRLVAKPPTLTAFKGLQQSMLKLVLGIVVAWILGGFLEELIARGVILQGIEALLADGLGRPLAATAGILVAAVIAGVAHLYQGRRAMIIITQLSVLFGILFVVSGYNLWSVILCHGLYDTVAFIRFARGKSKYAKLPSEA